MRYTTIIDISEMPTIYGNINARLVYLHLVLKSGYHDDDRDMITMSIRRIAADLNLSLSAVRHAIAQLERAHLLQRTGPVWAVKKWIVEQKITSRPRTQRQQKQIEIAAERQRQQEQRERDALIEQQRRAVQEARGKTPFMIFYEGLEKKAAAGDLDAAESIKKWRKTYDDHAAQMRSKSQ